MRRIKVDWEWVLEDIFNHIKENHQKDMKIEDMCTLQPQSGGGISGTETRNGLSVGSDDLKKISSRKGQYGKFNANYLQDDYR